MTLSKNINHPVKDIPGKRVDIEIIDRQAESTDAYDNSEEKFRTIFDHANDLIAYVSADGRLLEANAKTEEIFGFPPDEAIGKHVDELIQLFPEEMIKRFEKLRKTGGDNLQEVIEIEAHREDGKAIFLEVTTREVKKNGMTIGYISILRDISMRKRMEKALRKHQNHLEALVKERTAEIEETNTALSVLVEKMRTDKESIEKSILDNIKQLIIPNLKRIQKGELKPQQRLRLETLKKHLNEITSPLTGKMTANFFNFTSMEIQVADLIVHGKTTKEIAMILNVSAKAIGFHRGNIRAKIGIKNKNDSLRLSLLSLQQA